MIYIGIDTGVHTGIAVWDNKQRSFECVDAVKIHQAMKTVSDRAKECLKSGYGSKRCQSPLSLLIQAPRFLFVFEDCKIAQQYSNPGIAFLICR